MRDNEKWKAISKLLNHKQNSTVQPIKVGDEFLFEDCDILKEMEKYHVEKESTKCTSSDALASMINKWKVEASMSASETSMDKDITLHEVNTTFGLCSGAPGNDGVFSKLIDNASRDEMAKCLWMIWGKSWKKGKFIKE